jgi:hypothetical protein
MQYQNSLNCEHKEVTIVIPSADLDFRSPQATLTKHSLRYMPRSMRTGLIDMTLGVLQSSVLATLEILGLRRRSPQRRHTSTKRCSPRGLSTSSCHVIALAAMRALYRRTSKVTWRPPPTHDAGSVHCRNTDESRYGEQRAQ